jgi:hypothetical protein
MLQVVSIGILYFFALVGVIAAVVTLGVLYVLYSYDVRINIGNIKEEVTGPEKKAVVRDASTQKA